MNLDDFEDDIEPTTILRRGLIYYHEGSVLSLRETGAHAYSAKVAGSQVYEVTVTLDDDRELEDVSCTCPYDWGEYCKHEVAVLYALRDLLDGQDTAETQQAVKAAVVERPASVDLRTLLQDVSKDALLTFLVGYGTKSPALVSGLVHAFPSSDDDFNLTNLGIEFRQACSQGTESEYCGSDYEWEDEDEDDYIWHFSAAFKQKIGELLEMIRLALMEGRIRYAGSIASMMVHEMSSLDCDTDHIGEDVERSVSQIALLFADVVPSLEDGRWLFAQFLAAADLYDSTAQATLLRLCILFAETAEDQEAVQTYLSDLASEETEGEWGFSSILKNTVELRHALLLRGQRVEEAQAFALENLCYDSLRKLAFERAMDTQDYALAQKLANEGLAMGKGGPQIRLSGGFNWGDLLFRVYQESGETEKIRDLAKSFLLGGNLSYYRILKDSYEKEAWETVVDGLLDELQAGQKKGWGYRSNPYPEVLKAEKKFQRLLSYVQKNPCQVRSFQDVLLPSYQDEVFALYRQIILERGEEVASRDEYRGLASLVQEFAAIGGTSIAKECVLSLEPRYKKRPALKDELRKAGFL